jgi:hypothetical protein
VICDLAAFSFTEDSFGLVQKDLPLTLEALVRCQAAMSRMRSQKPRILPAGSTDGYERDVVSVVESTFDGNGGFRLETR